MSRTAEFVLALLGGIFGIFGAIFSIMFGSLTESNIQLLGWSALVFSTVAIVSSVLVRIKPKIAGGLMLVSAVGGLVSISLFYVLPFILLVVGGLMSLLRKSTTK